MMGDIIIGEFKMMKSSWWKLSIVSIFIIICNPITNSYTLDTNDKINHDRYEQIIPDYINNWHVDKSSSIQNVKTYIPDFQKIRTTIIETYNNSGESARDGPMDSA